MGRSCVARYLCQRPDDGDQDQCPADHRAPDGEHHAGIHIEPCEHAIGEPHSEQDRHRADQQHEHTQCQCGGARPCLADDRTHRHVPRHLHVIGARARLGPGTGRSGVCRTRIRAVRSVSVMLSRGLRAVQRNLLRCRTGLLCITRGEGRGGIRLLRGARACGWRGGKRLPFVRNIADRQRLRDGRSLFGHAADQCRQSLGLLEIRRHRLGIRKMPCHIVIVIHDVLLVSFVRSAHRASSDEHPPLSST